MVEITEDLRCLFSARLERRDGSYVLEVPAAEVESETVQRDEVYRIAVLDQGGDERSTPSRGSSGGAEDHPDPPVEEGEIRTVTVDAKGDEGDGIAKVERGYVVIVPDASPGEEVIVEIDEVTPNVAFATVRSEDGLGA